MLNLIFLLLGIFALANAHAPTVKTQLGPIRGSILQTILGKPIYAFRGIRFGKALRFEPPEPVEPWTDVYDATHHGAPCAQPWINGTSEDCLFLNVYTAKLADKDQSTKLPVFVYIHPGGYSSGSTEWAGPEYFLDQEIVLVAIQYRLATLGFLSTGDKLAPGNNAMKDQVLALKWVKNNIAVFGGDPNLVTIAGYSAGGSSVSLHLVSPMSKGLFQRAIIMSGSSVGNWPVQEDQFDLAQKQARLVGCPDDTSANIINCLKKKPVQELLDTVYTFDEFGYEPILIWLPVIERDFGQERFLTEDPAKLIQCGKFEQVPVMTTITNDEFSNHASYILENSTLHKQINEDFETIAPIVLIYERHSNNSKHVSKELRKFYFGDAPISNETSSGLEKILADGITGFGVYRAAELLASKSTKDVFYYRFDYHGTSGEKHVVHHDDLRYILYIPDWFPQYNATTPEYQMVTKLTTLLANFARTGNPTPTRVPLLDNLSWDPYTLQNKAFLDITDNSLLMKNNIFKERYDVWDRLFPVPNCDKH